MTNDIAEIIDTAALRAVFQPILDLGQETVHGYEGLIRGPLNSPLEEACRLLQSAREIGRGTEAEWLCAKTIIHQFLTLELHTPLFLNMSFPVLRARAGSSLATLEYLGQQGMSPGQFVIELTEGSAIPSFDLARRVTALYRARGYKIGLDDLGSGYASLRLWLEIKPDYVKLDKEFIRGADTNTDKVSFLWAVRQIAADLGTKVVVEGIETFAEYHLARRVGFDYGQGFFIGRPEDRPTSPS